MSNRNLKGYAKKQRDMAYGIRSRVIENLNLSNHMDCRLYDRLMAITSPMFFIKYRELLEDGRIIEALDKYQEANYQRRARFAGNSNGR